MAQNRPKPISATELAKRERRITESARRLGFVGRIEYRHVYSRVGGAQYGLARDAKDDLLIVYAEAFDKDADPREFSLEAMIAHERGHQMMYRQGKLKRLLPESWTGPYEEIMASILGAVLVESERDAGELLLKAYFESVELGMDATISRLRIKGLFEMFRRAL